MAAVATRVLKRTESYSFTVVEAGVGVSGASILGREGLGPLLSRAVSPVHAGCTPLTGMLVSHLWRPCLQARPRSQAPGAGLPRVSGDAVHHATRCTQPSEAALSSSCPVCPQSWWLWLGKCPWFAAPPPAEVTLPGREQRGCPGSGRGSG